MKNKERDATPCELNFNFNYWTNDIICGALGVWVRVTYSFCVVELQVTIFKASPAAGSAGRWLKALTFNNFLLFLCCSFAFAFNVPASFIIFPFSLPLPPFFLLAIILLPFYAISNCIFIIFILPLKYCRSQEFIFNKEYQPFLSRDFFPVPPYTALITDSSDLFSVFRTWKFERVVNIYDEWPKPHLFVFLPFPLTFTWRHKAIVYDLLKFYK